MERFKERLGCFGGLVLWLQWYNKNLLVWSGSKRWHHPRWIPCLLKKCKRALNKVYLMWPVVSDIHKYVK